MNKYFKQNKVTLSLIILCKAIYCIAITLVPIFVGKVIDLGLQSLNNNVSIGKMMVHGITLFLIIVISYYASIKLNVVFIKKIRQRIEYDVLNGIMVNNIDVTKSTNLLVNEIDLVIDRYFRNIIRWPDLIIPLVIGLIYTFSVSYMTMLIMISVLFVVMIINQILVKPFSNYVQELENSKAETNKIMLGFLNAMTTISIFSKNEFVKVRMTQEVKEKMSKELKLRNFEVFVEALNNFFSILMQLIPIIVLALMVYNNKLTTGEALSIILLFEKIVAPIEDIGNLKSLIGSVTNIKKYMEDIMQVEQNEDSNMFLKRPGELSIKFVDLSYKYDEKYVFEGLNFEIENNKKYLLKGESGSGKSTIFKILTKQITDYKGSIYINGVELREISKNQVYNILGVLLQKPQFIVGSVGENISFKENYDQESIENALVASNFMTAIDHIDDEIVESYNNFSGGELQRIALARIFYHEKKVLLLDEITSSLDKRSAREVEKTILNINDGTIINISHRSFSDLEDKYDGVINLNDYKINKGVCRYA